MKTIAQQIKWDFETNGFLEIKNKNDRTIYYENLYGDWAKYEWDSQGNKIYVENSAGVWAKWEYDSKGNRIYYENSRGEIIDHRPTPCENKEIIIEGVKYKLTKV